MASNYPPGVTGGEFEIAGPDYSKESEVPCPYEPQKGIEDSFPCGEPTMEEGFGEERWLVCDNEHITDLELDDGVDPDRAYDEERDRQMLGIDVPDGACE